MSYVILFGPSPDELSAQVNKYIAENWRPQGGLVMFEARPPDAKLDHNGEYWGGDQHWYAQAMVRLES